MRSRGTLRPRRTFSRNGITSSGCSGPPKETSRMASPDLVIQGLEQVGQRDFDGGIFGAQHAVFSFVEPQRGVYVRAALPGIDQPHISHAESEIVVDLLAYPAHAIFRRQDFDCDEGRSTEYRIVRYRLEVNADVGNPVLARANADTLFGQNPYPEPPA